MSSIAAAGGGGYSLSEDDLKKIIHQAATRGFSGSRFDCFVETGTFLGQTVVALAQQFQEVHTIEIRWPCFLAATLSSWKAGTPITFHLGESQQILPELVPLLGSACVFFLDAHFSGGPTGGQGLEVPLLRELKAIDGQFRHAALVIIDDMDMFGKEHTFDSCDDNWKFTGFCKTDWRGMDAEAVLSNLNPDRVACSFAADQQNRFVVGLEPLERQPPKARVGSSKDWVFSHTHFRSRPGRLDPKSLRELKQHGRGWSDIAAMIEGAFYSGKDGARGAAKPRSGAGKLELNKVQMTKEQCEDMHDAFIVAYATEEFQQKLRAAFAEAGDDKLKQLVAKQETCLPIQLEIIARFSFESSKKGVVDSLGVSRIYFENDEVIHEKGMLLSWLVDPYWQAADPGYGRERLGRWLRRPLN